MRAGFFVVGLALVMGVVNASNSSNTAVAFCPDGGTHIAQVQGLTLSTNSTGANRCVVGRTTVFCVRGFAFDLQFWGEGSGLNPALGLTPPTAPPQHNLLYHQRSDADLGEHRFHRGKHHLGAIRLPLLSTGRAILQATSPCSV
jgi:hypothetical protein